jgi:hypothetical protein
LQTAGIEGAGQYRLAPRITATAERILSGSHSRRHKPGDQANQALSNERHTHVLFVFAMMAGLRSPTSLRANRDCDSGRAVEMQERTLARDAYLGWIGFPNLGELAIIPLTSEARKKLDG